MKTALLVIVLAITALGGYSFQRSAVASIASVTPYQACLTQVKLGQASIEDCVYEAGAPAAH